jgi:hypothetical protein
MCTKRIWSKDAGLAEMVLGVISFAQEWMTADIKLYSAYINQ